MNRNLNGILSPSDEDIENIKKKIMPAVYIGFGALALLIIWRTGKKGKK